MKAFTYFDSGYMDRGLVAISSYLKYVKSDLIVYCLDDASETEVKKHFGDLVEVIGIKNRINKKEDYFKLSPTLLLETIKMANNEELVLYFDADTKFYSDLVSVEKAVDGYNFGFTTHRLSEKNKKYQKYGFYNFGFNYFRANDRCLKFIEEWIISAEKEESELSYYSDQLFLNNLIDNDDVKILDDFNVNIGPWCCDNGSWSVKNGEVHFNNKKIIHYHFSAICRYTDKLWSISSNGNRFKANSVIKFLYVNYIFNLTNEKKGFNLSIKSILILIINIIKNQIVYVER